MIFLENMISEIRYRKILHYSLIAAMVMIQGIILIFFYNEYFVEKKLNEIENQLRERHSLKALIEGSRSELLSAQNNLQKYIVNNNNKYLKQYFQSLKRLTGNLDSINQYSAGNESLQNLLTKEDESNKRLSKLEKLIDSNYKKFQAPQPEEFPFELIKYEFKHREVLPEVEIQHTTDSIEKRNFFFRLRNAVKGKVDVKRETTIITIKESSALDTTRIKADMDSIIDVVNTHYINEMEKYRQHIAGALKESTNLYSIYENLIESSNSLMKIYDVAVEDFNKDLELQYEEQNSQRNRVRHYLVLGLMALMFIVLILVIFLTRQSFNYEKRLHIANDEINRNLKFKNRVLGMLSHDIRSPLKIVNILIDRISKKNSDTTIAEYLKSIKFTNSSLLIQANQILEYTRNQDMAVKLITNKGNLRDEIETILTSFEPFIESRNNKLESHISVERNLMVEADFIKIYQLFANILGNANKFTENGVIKVDADIIETKDDKVKLEVSVTDTGTGISSDDLKRIFEPYYKGVLSDKIDNLGAGLGLNLCKEIVTLFGGTIWAVSNAGEGTTVKFNIKMRIVK